MVSESRLTLNLQYPNIAQVAYAMQGDRLSRAVVADLVDGSTPWAPPAGAYGLITADKPDGTFAVYDTLADGSPAIVIDGSTVTLYLAEQVLADAGAVKMSVAFFTAAGARLTTFRWTEVVAPEAVLDRVASGNYISILTATMAEAAQIFDQIKAAYGAPRVASTAAAMTDQNLIYVYTGTTGGGFTNGHWYYWDGTAWADGGNYNSTAINTDTTLTVAGMAADAKATGDAVGNLKSALTTFTGNKNYDFTEGKYIATNGTSVNIASPDSASGYRYAIADCSEGDVFIISGRGSSIAGLWAFAKANGEIITKSDSTSQVENLEIVAPVNAAILVVNSNRTPVLCQKGDALVNRVEVLEAKQEVIEEKQEVFEEDIEGIEIGLSNLGTTFNVCTNFEQYYFDDGKYIQTNDSTVNINNKQSAEGYMCTVANCVEGDILTVSGRGSTVAALWTFIDSSGNILSQSTSTSQETDIEITAPADSVYLVVNSNRQPVKCWKGDPLVNRVSALESEQEEISDYIDDIKIFDQTGNVYNAKSDALSGQYYYRSGTSLVTGTNVAYNGFIIPVVKNSHYTFVTSNIILLDASKNPLGTEGSWDYEGVTSCDSGNATFFAVTYRTTNVPAEGYAISKGYVLDYGDYAQTYYAKSLPSDIKSTIKTVSGAIASGESLSISGKSAVKDGQEIIFKGKFSSFNELKIDFSSTSSTNYVSVTSANLIVSNNTNSTITEAHGLTIANEITLLLELKQSNMYVSVTSGGVTFKYNCVWNQTGGMPVEIVADAVSMAFTDAKLSVNYSSARRSIWYFGDSYVQFGTDTRIPYYMIEYGFDKNVMINAVSGGTSFGGYESFGTLLMCGTPKFAIFALGMNNGDTDASTPNTYWLEYVQRFILDCKNNGIVPILCTIPTVPTVINEAKNTWVKSSGERYIDYASAVGADSSGTWYTGMLSSDNVHPSKLGGNALFTQLISDLPEVMG